ncbi:arylamine N-acetyltransferase [Rhodanobacter sp. L36]|uniref:arylamine N-acetyltransferase family protein n=1 Tax=Rhodanobacter sp. L36 TaxID=1747221 RepID=UPI00131E119B|nr:arylamine N-acetyltransferase [Rhodanobacter sp. L36]
MQPSIDLSAYLRRIGLPRPLRADAEHLQALATAHVASIAFESLNPLLGLPVDLALPALENKLIRSGRGGYCFEQNLLFAAALRAVGYEVSYLIARVMWNQPEEAITGQTHILVRVEIDGESWLADVGFGGQALSGALRLLADIAQDTRLEPYRLLQSADEWRMQSLVRGQWLTLYRFDLRPAQMIDCIISNHYVSTHPASRFVNNLIVARTEPGRRLSMLNHEFTIRRPGHEPERHILLDHVAIRRVLEQEFLLRLPEGVGLDQRLQQLPVATDRN